MRAMVILLKATAAILTMGASMSAEAELFGFGGTSWKEVVVLLHDGSKIIVERSLTLTGGSANDLLVGNAGADMLFGGGGEDTYAFTTGDGEDLLSDWSGDGHGGDGQGKIVFDNQEIKGAFAPKAGSTTQWEKDGWTAEFAGVFGQRGMLTISKTGGNDRIVIPQYMNGELGIGRSAKVSPGGTANDGQWRTVA